jgi:hypothetical protein
MLYIHARLIGISLLFGLTVPFASAAEYTLMPNPQTVHVGYFSAALKPVLTINSGDTVTGATPSARPCPDATRLCCWRYGAGL